ncbi:hypothetical protein [Streptomyces decoyicus]|uniref:hypothetical protein n=1 Tax=Streptomyces decoyicus TaxID=249567 RepID=UPI002E178086|nr:hypothetical protein OG532_36710 [Streptomyces decoyicus]
MSRTTAECEHTRADEGHELRAKTIQAHRQEEGADGGADPGMLSAIAAGAVADAVTENAPLLPSEAEVLEILTRVY